MVNFISVANSVNGSCPWLKQPIPCDFSLYGGNATDLTDSQKLLPNTDITGRTILKLFMVNTFFSIALVIALLFDEGSMLFKFMSKESYLSVRRLVHTIDTLLHTMSDAQVATGLALLLVVTFHASCISAYHYNVVCYLMLMSLVTHVLAYVNIPDFVKKSNLMAALRVFAVLAIIILTWMLFKARDAIEDFPVDANSLAIMPAACFVGNQTTVLGVDYFSSHNVSQILGSTGSTSGSTSYRYQFLPMAILCLFGFIFLIVDSISAIETGTLGRRRVVFFFRVVLSLAVIILAFVGTIEYFKLKAGFEIDAWYKASDEDTASLSQIIAATLSIPSVFAVIKCCVESMEGPRGQKEAAALYEKLHNAASYLQTDNAEQYLMEANTLKNDATAFTTYYQETGYRNM